MRKSMASLRRLRQGVVWLMTYMTFTLMHRGVDATTYTTGQTFTFTCSPGQGLRSLSSTYDTVTKDRAWTLACHAVEGTTGSCTWTAYSTFNSDVTNLVCSGGYISAVESEWSATHKDRRWKVQCCALTGPCYDSCRPVGHNSPETNVLIEAPTSGFISQITMNWWANNGDRFYLARICPYKCNRRKSHWGVHFVFGFLEQEHAYKSPGTVQNRFIIIAREASTVDVRYGNGSTVSKSLAAGDSLIQHSNLQMFGFKKQTGKAIEVVASKPVMIQALSSYKLYPDTFLVLPAHALGTSYILYSYSIKTGVSDTARLSGEAVIIATEASTSVSITVGSITGTVSDDASNSYNAGDVITVTLNKLEAYQVKCLHDITGWRVTATKPVAVISGQRVVFVTVNDNYDDHMVEMLPPLNQLGKHFTLAPTKRAGGDVIRLISPHASTTVSFPGSGLSSINLNAWKFSELTLLSNKPMIAASSKPILVIQYNKGASADSADTMDPFSLVVVPVEQLMHRYSFCENQVSGLGLAFNAHRVTVAVPVAKKDGLLLDGAQLTGLVFTALTGTVAGVTYTSARIDVTSTGGCHVLSHQEAHVRYFAYYWGGRVYNSIGTITGTYTTDLTTSCSVSVPFPSDNIDNDCDGFIDEEIHDGIDNDGDGKIDEDTEARVPTLVPPGDFISDSCDTNSDPSRTGTALGLLQPLTSCDLNKTGASVIRYTDTVLSTCHISRAWYTYDDCQLRTDAIKPQIIRFQLSYNITYPNRYMACNTYVAFGSNPVKPVVTGCDNITISYSLTSQPTQSDCVSADVSRDVTWTLTDPCGGVTTHSQTITLTSNPITTTTVSTTTTTVTTTTAAPTTTTTTTAAPTTTTAAPTTTTTTTTTAAPTTTTTPTTTTAAPTTTTATTTAAPTTTTATTTAAPTTTTADPTTTTAAPTTTTAGATSTTVSGTTTAAVSTTASMTSTAATTDSASTSTAATGAPSTSASTPATSCPPITPPAHGFIRYITNSPPTIAILICDRGYVLANQKPSTSVVCLNHAQWSAILPGCQPILCPPPPMLATTSVSVTGRHVGAKAEYKCLSGRFPDGATKRQLECSLGGSWEGRDRNFLAEVCADNRCYAVPHIDNGTADNFDTTLGNVVTLTCNEGYSFHADNSTQMNITCHTDGRWKPNPPPCLLNTCGTVPTPSFAVSNSSAVVYGSVIEFTCRTGYRFPGNDVTHVISCNKERKWNATVPNCEIIQCPQLPVLTTPLQTGSDVTYGSVITYSCSVGKFTNGHKHMIIKCGLDFQWNGTATECKENRCDPMPSIKNAVPDQNVTDRGTVVTFTCVTGHHFGVGNMTHQMECTENGWTGLTTTHCTPVECQAFVVPENSTANTDQFYYGSDVKVLCNAGHVTGNGEKEQQMTCRANAQWDKVPKACSPLHCPSAPVLNNATTNDTGTIYNTVITYHCDAGHWFTGRRFQLAVRCDEHGTWENLETSGCAEVYCPILPKWSDMAFSDDARAVKSVISYSCIAGFAFTDAADVKNITCTSRGLWEPDIETCFAKESIAKDIKENKTEAKNAIPIGTTALILSIGMLSIALLLDVTKLWTDVLSGWRNVMSRISPNHCESNSSSPQSLSQLTLPDDVDESC